MKKKKTVVMFALWNFDILREVGYYRRTVREAANATMAGGKLEADRMFRSGAFRISKVRVREV